jgi:hypothetical protein
MSKSEIKILRSRIEKLNAEDFDLEAWKSATIVILDRIFGTGNQKSIQISKIKYEQSSWALRDAKGSKNLIDSCKKRGEEVLKVAIEELEFFGLPEETIEQNRAPFQTVIIAALEDELKISQFRALTNLLNSDTPVEELRKKVIEQLNDYGHTTVQDVLSRILTSSETRKFL